MNHFFPLLNTGYHNITVKEALARVEGWIRVPHSAVRQVFFLNADCLRRARSDAEYRDVLNAADLVLSDGIGLRLATRLYGGRMKDNCNGTDFSPLVLARAADLGCRVFFLGGKPGVAQKAAENARLRWPTLAVAGHHAGYGFDDEELIAQINASGADILFVAMGAPVQEKWIARNRERLNPRLCLGVGAFLDYLSGALPRAPVWMRAAHVEWLWRVLVDPRRMVKRYLVDGVGFIFYLLILRSASVFGKSSQKH